MQKSPSCSICWYIHVLIISKAIVAEEFAPVLCHSFGDVVQLSQTLSPKLRKDGSQTISETLIIFRRLTWSNGWFAEL